MTGKRGGLATAQGSRQQCDAPDSLTLVLGLSLHSLMLMLAEHAEDDASSARAVRLRCATTCPHCSLARLKTCLSGQPNEPRRANRGQLTRRDRGNVNLERSFQFSGAGCMPSGRIRCSIRGGCAINSSGVATDTPKHRSSQQVQARQPAQGRTIYVIRRTRMVFQRNRAACLEGSTLAFPSPSSASLPLSGHRPGSTHSLEMHRTVVDKGDRTTVSSECSEHH